MSFVSNDSFAQMSFSFYLCVPKDLLCEDVQAPSRTKDKEDMPIGGNGDTPSCSPIRSLASIGKMAFSQRRTRNLQPAFGEPTIQSDRDQNPQPTVTGMGSDQENQHGMMISIPVGVPGEGQQCVPYRHYPQPPTSDAESGVLSVSTATLEGTPLGDVEPEGFHRSDTEPPTDPSVERELPEEAKFEDSRQVADDAGPNDQGAGNPEEPEEGGLPTQKVLNLLDGVSIDLKARQTAVLANIQVSLDSLLQVPVNPYGDVHTMEVQEPTLSHTLVGDFTLSPSAPPEILVEQVFQTKPFEQLQEPNAVHDESGVDQRVQSGLDQREERAT